MRLSEGLIPCPLFKRIDRFCMIPYGWGEVYYDLERRELVVAPIPFNIIAVDTDEILDSQLMPDAEPCCLRTTDI